MRATIIDHVYLFVVIAVMFGGDLWSSGSKHVGLFGRDRTDPLSLFSFFFPLATQTDRRLQMQSRMSAMAAVACQAPALGSLRRAARRQQRRWTTRIRSGPERSATSRTHPQRQSGALTVAATALVDAVTRTHDSHFDCSLSICATCSLPPPPGPKPPPLSAAPHSRSRAASHRTAAHSLHTAHIHIMALEVRLRAHGFCARELLGPMVISALSISSLRSLRRLFPSSSQPTDANLQALANVLRTTLGDNDKARKAGTNGHQHSATELRCLCAEAEAEADSVRVCGSRRPIGAVAHSDHVCACVLLLQPPPS